MKKILHSIYSLCFYFFLGLRNADKNAFKVNDNSGDNNSNLEVHDEEDSVYQDLLKGEVTQRVRELRHEMYYSERESHNYDYIGNGLARKKKNKIFSYNGKYEDSDGFPVELVHFNSEDTGGVTDMFVCADLVTKDERKFSYTVYRDFIPTKKVEEYTTKLIVKRISDEYVIVDIYIPKIPRRFDRRNRMFTNEMERIYMGDTRSEVLDIKGIEFITHNTWGSDDNIVYKFKIEKFISIFDFDGDYVLKFEARQVDEKVDLLDEIYDKTADEKFKSNAPREGKSIINYVDVAEKIEEEKLSAEQMELFNSFKNDVQWERDD